VAIDAVTTTGKLIVTRLPARHFAGFDLEALQHSHAA